ncbi:hypothetical protein ACIRL3_23995 [Streptomyces sp. NPDC102384]
MTFWLVAEPEHVRRLSPTQRAAVCAGLDEDQRREKAEQATGRGHGGG